MNEHLKYRVWNPKVKNWDDGVWFYQSGQLDHDTMAGEINKCVVQRFTGMKDTRGTPIYEGDILQEIMTEEMAANGDSSTLELVFFTMGTYFIGDLGGPFYDHVYSHSPDILDDYVVVGNKFETPKLLFDVSL